MQLHQMSSPVNVMESTVRGIVCLSSVLVCGSTCMSSPVCTYEGGATVGVHLSPVLECASINMTFPVNVYGSGGRGSVHLWCPCCQFTCMSPLVNVWESNARVGVHWSPVLL